jgi:hypothetical protein
MSNDDGPFGPIQHRAMPFAFHFQCNIHTPKAPKSVPLLSKVCSSINPIEKQTPIAHTHDISTTTSSTHCGLPHRHSKHRIISSSFSTRTDSASHPSPDPKSAQAVIPSPSSPSQSSHPCPYPCSVVSLLLSLARAPPRFSRCRR